MRATLRRLTAAAALTALSVATLGTVTATPASAAERSMLTGVQVHVLAPSNTAADVTRQLDLLAELGSTSLRADVSWGSLQETGPDGWAPWYVSRVDALVEGANARGMKPVLTLLDSPCWASTAPESLRAGCSGAWWDRGVQYYAPRDAAAYGKAAAFLAERYGDKLAALELWNEPNYDDQGFSPFIAPDRATAYTALLKAAYPAVKAVAPSLPVLAGALSFSDVSFTRRMWAAGALGNYDALSVHPYNGHRAPGTPVDPRYAMYDYTTGLAALHAAQQAVGDTSDLWITEMGWTDCVGSHSWCVSSAQQADYLARAVALADAMPWVAAFLSYDLRDNGRDRSHDQHNYGLVTRDYVAKPAFAALKTAFRTPAAPAAPAEVSTPTTSTPATTTAPAAAAPAAAAPAAAAPAAAAPAPAAAAPAPAAAAPAAAPRKAAPRTAPKPAPKAAPKTARKTAPKATAPRTSRSTAGRQRAVRRATAGSTARLRLTAPRAASRAS